MKNVTFPIVVSETSGATFTSSSYDSTVEEMIGFGYEITDEMIADLEAGKLVSVYSYNMVGTATRRTLRKK
jgi:hypothetical protein